VFCSVGGCVTDISGQRGGRWMLCYRHFGTAWWSVDVVLPTFRDSVVVAFPTDRLIENNLFGLIAG
jgi:hypothetical protein